MKKLFILLLSPTLCFSQTAPKLGINEVYRTTLTVSWTIPNGSTTIEVERATNRNFFSSTQIYDGISSQISEQVGLSPNKWYYFRARANYTGKHSVWSVDSVKTFWTPYAANLGGNRIATTSDLSIHPFINVGDYLIVGCDGGLYKDTTWKISVGTGTYGGVGHSATVGLKIPALPYYKNKIIILGGTGYDYISLDLDNVAGTKDSLRVITVIGGQTKAKLYLSNMRHCKLTGKYDSLAKTGDPLFKGFDNSDWNRLEGSFAFFTQGRYDQPNILLSHLQGKTDSSIIEYVESGEGGFSGITIKNDNSTAAMNGITIRKCYTHDTGGEGYYIGSTQAGPQMPVIGFELYDNIVARAGLNGLQVGQMKRASNIHNNVFISSGFKWNTSFAKYQDQAIQLHSRENGTVFRDNIICGSAGEFINWFMVPDPVFDTPAITQTTYVNHNLFTNSKSYDGGYITARVGFRGTANLDSNYFGGVAKSNPPYKAIFNSDERFKFKRLIGLVNFDSAQTIWNSHKNTMDNSVPSTLPLTMGSGRIKNNGNINDTHLTSSLPRPQFCNYMDLGITADYSSMEQWAGPQCLEWNKANRDGTAFYLIKQNNLSTSITSITIPISHPTIITAAIGRGMRYIVGEQLDFTNGSNTFKGAIMAYNSSTGAITLKSINSTGKGKFSNWNVALDVESIRIYRNYSLGDIVRHNGRFYKSLKNHNINHPPAGNTDQWWKLIIFSNGRIYPPDDVRLKFNDFYASQGIGLSSIFKRNN